ncbi:M23 family metallopeptidase [Trichococcus ilyis]|uniref:Peptidase m23 n=1 Tax=Trichococcus ilyis TaxID=640938 RepID=A0A143Z4K9_9LACT|nr:M23 family metallopeptidase [Trichococcus ilyis]CZR07176.1 peptidase m23 [Trichococcus ilyis]SEJ93191.1 Septal ring factor EnvC, activator of murein hydrolases AmiA and AmiB [Trichococcus ilyis]
MNRKQMLKILVIPSLLSLLVIPVDVKADTVEELNQQKTELESRIQELDENSAGQQELLDTLDAKKEQLGVGTITLQKEIDKLTLQLVEQQGELQISEKKIEELGKETEILEEQIELRGEKLEVQARAVQTDASPRTLLETVINSENLVEMIGNMSLVNRIMNINKETLVQQKKDKVDLVEKKQAAEKEQEKLETLNMEIQVAKTNLVTQKAGLENQIEQLGQEYELTLEQKEAIAQEQQNLAGSVSTLSDELKEEQRRIADEEAARQQAAQDAAVTMAGEIVPETFFEESNVVEYASAGENLPEVKTSTASGFIRPSNGVVTDPFGYRVHPITGDWKLHAGMDFAGSGPIVAAKEGTVLVAGYHNSWGYYVKIDHGNGLQTLYAHMEAGSLRVAPGQKVSQGQQLGIMGTTGDSTGVHLHFEVYENGVQVDPEPYLGL